MARGPGSVMNRDLMSSTGPMLEGWLPPIPRPTTVSSTNRKTAPAPIQSRFGFKTRLLDERKDRVQALGIRVQGLTVLSGEDRASASLKHVRRHRLLASEISSADDCH